MRLEKVFIRFRALHQLRKKSHVASYSCDAHLRRWRGVRRGTPKKCGEGDPEHCSGFLVGMNDDRHLLDDEDEDDEDFVDPENDDDDEDSDNDDGAED